MPQPAASAPNTAGFHIEAKVQAFGFKPSADADASPNPLVRELARRQLQSTAFAQALGACYKDQPSARPVDTTIHLDIDARGHVTNAVLEGVPAAVAPCVNGVFGAFSVPGFTGLRGGTLAGVVGVQSP
ncbi:MAG: hypothetical protein QM756_08430 [Polyangiaceae bacterium]